MSMPNPSLPNPQINFEASSKKILWIVLLFVNGFLVFCGDRVCFVREADSLWEKLLAYPTAWGFSIFEDRFFSGAFAFCIWSLIVGLVGYVVMTQVERRWIEPRMMKKTLEQLEREKRWINQYGKDLF